MVHYDVCPAHGFTHSEQKLKAAVSSTVLYVRPHITGWVLAFPDEVMCYCLLPAAQLGRGPLYWEVVGGGPRRAQLGLGSSVYFPKRE